MRSNAKQLCCRIGRSLTKGLTKAPSAQTLRHLSRVLSSTGTTPLRRQNPPRTATRCLHALSRQYSTSTSSVDPTEISHFNRLASSWWDPHGPSRLLHLMNPIRIDFVNSCLAASPHARPKQIDYLDIGCGGGIFAESAARLPGTRSVTAIDPSGEVLEVARAHARRDPRLQEPGRLNYINTSVEDLAKHTDRPQYDLVTLFEVIEHVSDPSAFLSSVTSHVKPGGWIIVSTIARTWTSWFTTKLVAEDVLGIVPQGTHEWAKYINESELRGWFTQRGGWEGARAMGVMYVPGVGWREVRGGEDLGNYFFGIRKSIE